MEVGRLACGHLLAQSKRPTAILCSNDMTAIGVMRKCYEDGIAIPRDLSVVGFDDIRLAQFMLPPLTRSEEHTSELQSQSNLVCRLLLEKKKLLQPTVHTLLPVDPRSAPSSRSFAVPRHETLPCFARPILHARSRVHYARLSSLASRQAP